MPEPIYKKRSTLIEHSEILSAQKLLSSQTMTIYHGNKTENLTPTYGLGSKDNDYGRGFYTTPDIELAKEWAWGTYSAGNKEVSTNNRYKFAAIFIVFPDFFLNKL